MPLFPYVVFFQKLISIVYRWFHVRLSGTSILHGLLDLTLLDRCMVSKWKHDPIISISCLSGIAFATVFKPRKICTFSWYQYLTSKGPGKWTPIRIYILGRRLFSHYFTNLLGATLQQVKSLAQSYLNILLLYNNLLSPMAVYGAPTLKPSQVFGTWCEPERINQIWSIFAGSIMIILSEIFFMYFSIGSWSHSRSEQPYHSTLPRSLQRPALPSMVKKPSKRLRAKLAKRKASTKTPMVKHTINKLTGKRQVPWAEFLNQHQYGNKSPV